MQPVDYHSDTGYIYVKLDLTDVVKNELWFRWKGQFEQKNKNEAWNEIPKYLFNCVYYVTFVHR